MFKPIIHVFLSSTFLDLKEHRRRILDDMMRLQWVYPRCMEFQTAVNDDALSQCLKMMGDCAVYVGIIGSRYGGIPGNGDNANATGLSSISHNSAPQLILWN